jgi:thiol-disulfide isomerase/thioredoxin
MRKIPFLLQLLLACFMASSVRAVEFGLLGTDEHTAGVGIALGSEEEFIFVAKIIPDSPAAASQQIHEGDRILAMGEGEEPSISLVGKSILDCVGLIRGTAGSRVRLTVMPKGGTEKSAREVLLTRDELQNQLGLALDATLLKPGTAAPELRYVRLDDGKETTLAEACRGKMVMVDFWATWCAPCQQVITDLQKLAAKHADQKDRIVFLTISIDGDSASAKGPAVLKKVAAHAKGKGWTATTNGWASIEGRKDWYIGTVPTTYLIGADGKIIVANPDAKTMGQWLPTPTSP